MEHTLNTKKPSFNLSSFALHILAMGFMLCDHLWATLIPGNQWLTIVGRLTFPIYAFMIVEGYYHTSDLKKYIKRLLIFAILSEIPFNLMYAASFIYPFQQNVMWTFLLGIFCMKKVDKAKEKYRDWKKIPVIAAWVALFYIIGQITFVDYHGYGVLMIMLFYFLRGNSLLCRLGQLAGMIYINAYMVKGLNIMIELGGNSIEVPQQAFAVFALIFIWLYKGRQGYHNKVVQYIFYAFYPVHMLILGLLSM